MSDRRPPPHLGAVALPALSPREAEIIIDLIGQLQAVLWDAYGEAILALPTDQEQSDDGSPAPPPVSGGDPIF